MSANNYGICPRCFSRKKKAIEDGRHEIERLYGTIPQEEWSALNKRIRYLKSETKTRDLDERWEIGTEGEQDPPVFCVSYGCRCEVCGFEFSFQHREIVSVEEVSVNENNI